MKENMTQHLLKDFKRSSETAPRTPNFGNTGLFVRRENYVILENQIYDALQEYKINSYETLSLKRSNEDAMDLVPVLFNL